MFVIPLPVVIAAGVLELTFVAPVVVPFIIVAITVLFPAFVFAIVVVVVPIPAVVTVLGGARHGQRPGHYEQRGSHNQFLHVASLSETSLHLPFPAGRSSEWKSAGLHREDACTMLDPQRLAGGEIRLAPFPNGY
jgi:hypothetical protein